MARRITITTPENARIEYELAGIASRAGAAVVDSFIQIAFIGLLVAARAALAFYGKWPGTSYAEAALGIAVFCVFWGYYVLFETVWNGQTPGKRHMRLRVVRAGGRPVDLPCIAIRNLLRIIDFLPPPYLAGAISVMASARNQRLGDLAAGTLVVKERGGWADGGLPPETRTSHVIDAAGHRIHNLELVTTDEFEAARRFCERRAELAKEMQESIAAKIARPIMDRLGVDDDSTAAYADILREIYARCSDERGMR